MSSKKEIPFERSFASYTGKTANGKLKVDCWHPTKNGDLTPRNVTIMNGEKYWFVCIICKHFFETVISSVTGQNCWCPYCANKKLCKETNCNHCFNNSFASYTGKP